jgi:hypothetical protein
MGENEKLGFTFEVKPYDYRDFNRFFGATTDWVDEGSSATIPWNGNSCGTIPKLSPNDAERFAKVKTEMDAMAEKYKPIVDKLVEEIYKSSQNAPLLFTNPTTRKVRKRYKPKFTL